MKQKILLVFMIGTLIFAGQAKAETNDDEQYKEIVHNIIDGVKNLKNDYKHFSKIDEQAAIQENEDRFWITFNYENDLKWIKNPTYDPASDPVENLKTFTKGEGIDLTMYFYKGEWQGQNPVRPFHIGELNVVAFVEGLDTQEINEIRAKIGQIILAEKINFENN